LRTFCTLVETKHFTKTAEQLFITQSAVSQHLRKLEDLLDEPLIQKTEKDFLLTKNGYCSCTTKLKRYCKTDVLCNKYALLILDCFS
jgi:predicted transcriptional regulator